MFSFFKKKDPICGMKKEEGKGFEKYNEWFCSKNCLEQYENDRKQALKQKPSCCGGH